MLYPQFEKEYLSSGDMFARSTWFPAYTWTLLQAEEIFCDFFGLRLFAESYLHAFAYIISPGTSGQRSVQYPNITRRVSHLVEAANIMCVSVPPEFSSDFIAESEPADPATKLLVSIADAVSASLVPHLIDLAKTFAYSKAVPTRDSEKVSHICDVIRRWVVPASEQQSLVDILNAGWNCHLYSDLWDNIPQFMPKDKYRVLRDLILKSMEVSEIYKRLEKSP